MSKLLVKERLEQLRKDINYHNHLYHVMNAPVIPDAEFDALFQELVVLEDEHPEFADLNSPTARIGGIGTSAFEKVKHRVKMLSLDNAFSAEDVIKFLGLSEEVLMEPKIDGLSLSLSYENGRLVRAITRGDGITGDDVTANARTIMNVPLVLPEPLTVEVRGEVYMTFRQFNRLNAALEDQGEEPFANPRNAAAGSLKLKDPMEVARRRLLFVAYGSPDEFEGITTQEGLVESLSLQNFLTPLQLPVRQSCETIPQTFILQDAGVLRELIGNADRLRQYLDVATDGLVFKINRLDKQRELGDGTRSPNWAVAYKFPPERKATKLVGVSIQVGKSGQLTPVAELEPVTLGGTVVQRASLCNQDEIQRLDINIGDVVLVEKSAEIIPKVMGFVKEMKVSRSYFKMPLQCPSCGADVVKPEGFVDIYCPNSDCPAQVVARLRHAVGKQALDIDGCGEVLVEDLVKHGARRLSDVFSMQDLDFIKPAARRKFIEGREKAKRAPLWRKLHALGIDGIGKTRCQEIAAHWISLRAAFDEKDELKKVLGNVNFDNFVAFVQEHGDELDRLDALGVQFETEKAAIGPLSGKTFVITGGLVSGSRLTVSKRIEDAGGTVKSGVTKKINYLVVGAGGGQVKAENAKKHGTVCITERELYEMMGQPMPVITQVDPEREY